MNVLVYLVLDPSMSPGWVKSHQKPCASNTLFNGVSKQSVVVYWCSLGMSQ